MSNTSLHPATIVAGLHRQSVGDPDRTALVVDRGSGYQSLTWSAIVRDVEMAAASLLRLGMRPGEHVGLLGDNCYEWLIADLALQLLGAVSVPLHITLAAPQIAALLEHGDAQWLIAADTQLSKLASAELSLQGIVAWRTNRESRLPSLPARTHDWSELLASGSGDGPSLAAAVSQVEASQLATIIYTSGTTGEPKGVMLSHGNLAFNAWATWTTFGNPREERRFGLLPWSHAFARTCDLYAWIVSGTQLVVGRSRESAVADMQATSPTYLNGVPYFFQKVHRALEAGGGAERSDAARALLGGALRACCSGGAPLPDATFDFYQRQGLPVLEGYGMTEAGPVITTCTETAGRRGSVGRALVGVEIGLADDGEVLTRGKHVMQGYYKDRAGTAGAIRDGWLHTGDLGRLDDDGFLFLTGRKKELIVLSTGRKVSPALLESLLLQDPLIEQAVVLGDGQKELGALLAIDRRDEAKAGQPVGLAQVRAVVARLLKDRPVHEQVRRIAILDEPLSQAAGELSAKQSLCRSAIVARRAAIIRRLFQD